VPPQLFIDTHDKLNICIQRIEAPRDCAPPPIYFPFDGFSIKLELDTHIALLAEVWQINELAFILPELTRCRTVIE
jgi:hypothetical protein